MNIKAIVIVGSVLFVGVGFYVLSGDGSEGTDEPSAPKLTINGIPKLAKQDVRVKEQTKTEAYEKARIEEEEMEKQFSRDTTNTVVPLASAVTEVIAGQYQARLKEVKKSRSELVPVYNGKVYEPEVTKEPQEIVQANLAVVQPTPVAEEVRDFPASQLATHKSPPKETKQKRLAASISSVADGKKEVNKEEKKPTKTRVDSSALLTSSRRRTKKTYNEKEIIVKEKESPVKQKVSKQKEIKDDEIKEAIAAEAVLPQEEVVLHAAIYGDQLVKQNGPIRFRLMKEIIYKGIQYPKNTILAGKAMFGQDRLFVIINGLPNENGTKTIRVNFALYDTDLSEGIAANIDLSKEAATQETTNMGLATLTSAMGTGGMLANGASQIIRSSINTTQKVFVHDGDPVQFVEILPKK
jgi:hypothetical protein